MFLASTAAVSQMPEPTPFQATTAVSPTPAPQQTAAYVRPGKKARFSGYAKSMFGLETIGKSAFSAGLSTAGNSPEEWGGQWGGFGKRFASNMGKGIIRNTTAYALEEAFKLDSRYVKSQKKDAGSKIKNAFIAPFIARNEKGKKVFGFPRLVGSMVASVVAVKAWYPNRYGWKDGLRNGVTSIGTGALFNLVREFIR